MNYYNENDPKMAAWLRELIAGKLIPAGDVDERSIVDVGANDLRSYTSCHFFAGIGGWPYALRIAGWPDNKPVWTGSCPCQPFSCAGKGMAESDERHLWPYFRNLIGNGCPAIVFGEQVASKLGRVWLAGVRADLEMLGYAVGASDLCAAGIGAPHIRQRLFWLADSNGRGWAARGAKTGSSEAEALSGQSASGLAKPTRKQSHGEMRTRPGRNGFANGGAPSWMGSPIQQGLEGHAGNGDDGDEPGRIAADETGPASKAGAVGGMANTDGQRPIGEHTLLQRQEPGRHTEAILQAPGCGKPSFWSNSKWLSCRDGKTRRISTEPALFPLAHGLPGRVGLLRGAGNAIVPELAAQFIKAYCEIK